MTSSLRRTPTQFVEGGAWAKFFKCFQEKMAWYETFKSRWHLQHMCVPSPRFGWFTLLKALVNRMGIPHCGGDVALLEPMDWTCLRGAMPHGLTNYYARARFFVMSHRAKVCLWLCVVFTKVCQGFLYMVSQCLRVCNSTFLTRPDKCIILFNR